MDVKKPLTVERQDFIRILTDLINGSPLPFFVIESVLKDFISDVKVLGQKQLENDANAYRTKLEEHMRQTNTQMKDGETDGTEP